MLQQEQEKKSVDRMAMVISLYLSFYISATMLQLMERIKWLPVVHSSGKCAVHSVLLLYIDCPNGTWRMLTPHLCTFDGNKEGRSACWDIYFIEP